MTLNSFSLVLLTGGIVTLLISIPIFKRLGGAARWWGGVMLGISTWAIAYAIELSSKTLNEMLFWINIEYIGIALLPAIWFVFVLKYIGNKFWMSTIRLVLLFLPGIITLLLVWTKSVNQLHYASVGLDTTTEIPLLTIKPGPWYRVHTLYFYFLLASGVYLLIAKFKQGLDIYKKQTYLIIASAIIPWSINLLYLLDYRPLQHIDLTPFAFVISAIVIGIGMLKFDLFNIVPIARDTVFDSMEDAVFVLNNTDKIVDYNKAALILADNKKTQLAGFNLNEVLTNTNEIIEMVQNASIQKPIEEYIYQKNELYFGVTVTPLLNKNGMLGGTIVIFKNITHLKNTEKQLIVQAEALKNSNQIKDKIFSIVAHDLRTPLLNMNEVLSLTTQGLINPEELQEMLPMIQKDIQVTTGFLENLLHWSKSQLQGQNLSPQNFDLTELVNNIIQLFSLNAKDKQIALNNNLSESLMVYADKNTIQLVVRNLLSNALKFCRQNDTITVSASIENGFCKVCIADTGVGIAPNNIDKLFGLNNFTTKGSKNEIGTGLGLVLCKEFVEKNGGKIWVNSELGKGSKFCFTIPILQ